MDLGSLFNLDPSIVIDFMNGLLSQVFNLAENPTLQNWGNGVVADVAEKSHNQVTNQLGYDPTK